MDWIMTKYLLKERHMSKKTTSKTIWLLLFVSCLVVLSVYIVFTRLDYRQMNSALKNILSFASNRIEQCDNLNTNDRVKSLVRLVDKSNELSRVIEVENGLNTQTLEEYCSTQKVDGVFVLDENLNTILEYQNESVAWDDMIGKDSISNIPFSQKEYSIRIRSNEKIYDFAAVPRKDASGIVIVYQEKELLEAISKKEYFENYSFNMDGIVTMIEDGQIVSSSDKNLVSLTVEQIETEYGVVFEKENHFLKVSTIHGKYYGKKYDVNGYTLYIFYPQSQAFKTRSMAIWLSVTLLFVLWVALSFIRMSMEREKERENKLALEKAVEEAQMANAAKTNFLRRMSHDLRTPINGINGMVEISRHYAGDEEKQEECRKKITSASNFLLDLVNNVLDMSKLESGKIVLEEKPVNLNQLIHDTNSVIQVQAVEKGIQFEEHFELKHINVLASPIHIRQIIQNIESNAVKYTQNGGKVETYYREIFVDKNTFLFEFICKDNGMGMSEEFQKKAFEPFTQEFSNGRTTYEGSGLGLSITHELIKYMQGDVKLESKLHEGSQFIIHIPLKIDANRVEQEDEKAKKSDLNGLHILLVEDNEMNMEIAQFLLEKNGANITCAWNGQEAVDAFSKSEVGAFDVILMDIMMPIKDGLEATKEIRKMKRADAKSVVIIAMSANAFQDDIQTSIQTGMNGHLSKPLKEKDLISIVDGR